MIAINVMFYKKAALTQQMLYKVVIILPAHDILQCNFID